MHLAIPNNIIKRWSQDNAKKAVWGTNKGLLLEFVYNEDSVITTKEQLIRCPHCNQRLLDVEYVVGTIKCFRCKSIIKLKKVS